MKTTLQAITIIAAVALLGGCASPNPANMTATQIKDAAAVFRDDYQKTTSVESMTIRFPSKNEPSFTTYACQFLARKKDNGEVFYYLEFRASYGDVSHGVRIRAFPTWIKVLDRHGNEFLLEKTFSFHDRKEGCIRERFILQLSRKYLESMKETGVDWKFYGQPLSFETKILPQVIKGFLMRVDEEIKK